NGDVELWAKYCNSLRLRILMRVSESSEFASRANEEMAEIIGNPATYPLITSNDENAQIEVYSLDDNSIHTTGIRDAFEADGWYANLGSGMVIDHMVDHADPRLPYLFEPGSNAGGRFIGLDQSLTGSAQSELARRGTIAIFNRSTVSRNEYFPGVLYSAAETHLLLAEYYT